MSEESRIRWHCRRGMLELDLVLNSFLDNRFARLRPDEVAAFKELLAYPDQDLFEMVMGRADPPDGLLRMVLELLRAT